jgi:hypothetical protein
MFNIPLKNVWAFILEIYRDGCWSVARERDEWCNVVACVFDCDEREGMSGCVERRE